MIRTMVVHTDEIRRLLSTVGGTLTHFVTAQIYLQAALLELAIWQHKTHSRSTKSNLLLHASRTLPQMASTTCIASVSLTPQRQ